MSQEKDRCTQMGAVQAWCHQTVRSMLNINHTTQCVTWETVPQQDVLLLATHHRSVRLIPLLWSHPLLLMLLLTVGTFCLSLHFFSWPTSCWVVLLHHLLVSSGFPTWDLGFSPHVNQPFTSLFLEATCSFISPWSCIYISFMISFLMKLGILPFAIA